MTKLRRIGAGAAAAIAAGALLTGVAFAASDMAPSRDADDNPGAPGSPVAKLATSTTLRGEAKGDAISTMARAQDADDRSSASVDNDDHATTDRDAHGDAVSRLATTTSLKGEAKGDAISALASAKAHRR